MDTNVLFRVTMRVHPAAWHPRFYDWQFGFLCVWLYGAASEEDQARLRAIEIVRELPYEIVDEKASVAPADSEDRFIGAAKAAADAAKATAQEVGLALALVCCPPGADEGEVRFDWAGLL